MLVRPLKNSVSHDGIDRMRSLGHETWRFIESVEPCRNHGKHVSLLPFVPPADVDPVLTVNGVMQRINETFILLFQTRRALRTKLIRSM